MLKRFIYAILERRHYWRYIDFAELAELYASQMLRTLAVSMVSVLTAVFLYQNGYSLAFIMGYFACYFVVRCVFSFPAAFLIARIGPKHVVLLSNFLYVPALISITTLPEYGIISLIIFGVFQAISASLYEISYWVNFSKVKKDEHAGKELGVMYMLDRIAGSASPVVGGMVAFLFGPQATMIVAAILFGLAAVPLLFTGEPTKVHQKISFHGVSWKAIRKGLYARMAMGTDAVSSNSMWGLFLAISIFGSGSNAIYAQLGALASAAVVASLLFARMYGLIIDRRRGGELLKFGVISTSLIHLARPFISTPIGVLMTNVFNEAGTTAYSMPYTKGMFDMADSLPGFRIVYITLISIAGTLGGALFAGSIAVLAYYLPSVLSLQIGFVAAAFISLLIMRHGFPALAPRRFF